MRQGELSTRHRRDFCMPPWGKENMGAPNNALKAYMSRPDRIRSVLEYYLGEKLQDLAGDYRVHLVSMRNIPEKELQKMDSDLKYVLGILNRTASAKQYRKYIQDNRAYFSRIPRSAVDVIDSCTNIKKFRDCLQYQWNQDSGEEEADMCKALDDIEKYAMKKGIKQGTKQGKKQGERSGTLKTLFSLVNDGLVKPEEAARRAKLPEAEFCREMKKAGYSRF